MQKVQIQIPPKLIPVFSDSYRYRCSYGGRGSGKTRTFAKMSAVRGYMFAKSGVSGVILCGREFMNSLEESSLEEVKQAIRETPFLNAFYEVGEKYIRSKCGRIAYVFSGLRHNLDSIKSKARILIAWIDEAETVSETAWRKLTPTVREDGSEIWVTWNPEKKGSATDIRFRQNPPENAIVVEMNYNDNPWFPDVLEQERLSDQRRLDDATYRWIWEGDYLEQSDAQVFKGKFKQFEFVAQPDFIGPYHGLDFGFAKDPTAAVRCWVFNGDLYIDYCAGKVELELDDTALFLSSQIPNINQYIIRADSARPESICYLKRNGLPRIEGVNKWKGSVEDGIAHLKSYGQIYIHPRCAAVLDEFRQYSYKTDRLTSDVLPVIIDDNNHYIDAIRYALSPLIQSRGTLNQQSLEIY
ncbi:phage terminase large subunit [Avibacterium sp. 20-15]|uniref:PBSX family phage terminase large subunit n=1 Tax=unclassified Avibacterium TaxID=2685287 RepID=UPI0020264218|nr:MULTISPECIES: phage terminase large subunit [unclassified Avibacterium]MCW9731922.1 phage terminase large subunit [Avibacterium sp. 20-15]URL04111.1 phage terminase large subunit [Avibacterium sp. 20-132]